MIFTLQDQFIVPKQSSCTLLPHSYFYDIIINEIRGYLTEFNNHSLTTRCIQTLQKSIVHVIDIIDRIIIVESIIA